MKYRWDKKYLHWGITAFLVVIASISFFLILFRFDTVGNVLSIVIDVLKPIIYGLCIAYLLIPIMNYLEKSIVSIVLRIADYRHKTLNRFRLNRFARAGSIFLTLLLAVLFIIALFSLIIPQIAESITSLFESSPVYIANLQRWLSDVLNDNPDLLKNVESVFAKFSEYLENWMKNDLIPQINDLVKGVTSGVFGALNTLKNLLIGITVSVYVMISKDLFSAQAKRFSYALLQPEKANSLIATVRQTHKIFGGFISGKLLDSLIIGILCFIVMSIFNWPYAVLVSVIVGVTNVIPFFGPFIGAIPSAFLILLVDPMTCLYFVIFVFILQQFDGNILGPKILGDSTGLSSFWVIFAILIGGGLFGFIGMLIGVPTFAVIYTLVRSAIEKKLKEKELPCKTEAYQDVDYVDPQDGTFVRAGKELSSPKPCKAEKKEPEPPKQGK